MASPFPPLNLGPFGSLPTPELPTRQASVGAHKCDSCPGGALVDDRVLAERDPIARCFADCCIRCKDSDPQFSKMCEHEWDSFVRQLRDHELIDAEDVRVLNDSPFGSSDEVVDGKLDFPGFQRWLCQKLYGEDLRQFDCAAEAMRGAVHSVNISVCHRGLDSLNQKELYTYQVLLSEYEHVVADNLRLTLKKLRETEQEWERQELDDLLRLGGPSIGQAYTTGEDPGPLPTTPEEYQWARGPRIERELLKMRVASVVFPRRERLLEYTDWGMRRLIATAAISGEEVEVVEMPWDIEFKDVPLARKVSDRMEALKQLTLSPYFRDYRGFDFTSHFGKGMHFLTLHRGVNLRQLIKISGPISYSHPLFIHWAREILLGLRDYLHQCCQELMEDITLEHVCVTNEGLKVYFKNVPFGDRRGILYEDIPDYGPQNKWRNSFVAVENRLLTMYGNILMELLYGQQEFNSPIRTLHDLSRDWRSVISLAMNCRDTLDMYILGGDAALRRSAIQESPDPPSLAGGFVGAGIDEFNSDDEYKLWWLQEKSVRILPNTERSADDGSVDFLEDWKGEDDAYVPVTEAAQKVPKIEWKPNADLFTIQALLNHPALQHREENFRRLVMEAWDSYHQRYQANHAEQGRLEKFLDGI
mmetsp:Transcript_107646/g.206995  ORF Transcript_107646/g.206995 Transcript_107646/m.206995 type:complete len:644 (+) Transcript_107646:36-1967(+)